MFVELLVGLKEGTQKLISRLSEKWSGMFARIRIFFHGSRGQKGNGSRIRSCFIWGLRRNGVLTKNNIIPIYFY
jgi:hypothetical protein